MSGRIRLHQLNAKYLLVKSVAPITVKPQYPAVEFFHNIPSLSIFHNLDISKWKSVPNSYWNAMDYLYLTYYAMKEANNMPSENGKGYVFDPKSFIQFKLNSDERVDFTSWLESHAQNYDAYFRDLLIDGMKVSASFDARNDCFVSSITCKDEKSPCHGLTLTSRSEDEREALMLNYYKHHIVFKKRKWVNRNEQEAWG